MAEHRLMRRVDEVAGRLQQVRRLRWRLKALMLMAVVGLLLLAGNWLFVTPLLPPAMTIVVGVLLLCFCGLLSLKQRANEVDAARAIEKQYPDLDARLVTALRLRPNMEEGGFSFLQHEVISETLVHAQRHDWRDAVPTRTIAFAKLKQSAALLLYASAFVGAGLVAFRSPGDALRANMAELPSSHEVDAYGLSVEPGDIPLERGASLLVLARFHTKMPGEVTLVTNAADGQRHELSLSKSLDDPLFGGRIAQVKQDLNYHVQFDGISSDEYRVSVFDYPELLQADATIEYPEYTGLARKRVEDVRRVSLVEGSTLTIVCTMNKPVSIARLFADDGTDYTLTADEKRPNVASVTWTPTEKQTLALELIDEADRHNKQPPQFVVDVIPNQPPDLKVAFPAKDMRVSPLQEMALEAQVWDDFGLKEYGVVYQLPEGDEQTLKLGGGADADTKVDLAHELSFEAMAAQPNELVAYYFYADDIGPTGDSRRTLSHMYFAEVRHFDEIYQQVVPTGKGEGNMPSTKLLKLQRDVVTANWNLLRREHGKPSPELPQDAGAVADAEGQALELAYRLKETLEDPLSQRYIDEAIELMQAGREQLRLAATTPAIEPLTEARIATQGAYGALLKLQAREHLVMKQQGGKSSNSSAEKKLNEQLKQLELKNNRNRYEAEKKDIPPADHAMLQVHNRLKDLARRQGDLNEKIQELQNALRAVENNAEREEIERQLKRLQEEQQQLLRDLDELKERMEQPQNRSRMADARKQIEETRKHLRETKESLQAGQTAKALAEGTRAQRELEELKEEFRRQTANQFAETMRELRDEVRALAETEQELGDRLAGKQPDGQSKPGGKPRRKLREESPDGGDLPEAFADQQQRLANAMKTAEEVVRQAEVSEPLLSKKLYDSIRKTRTDQPEESLAMTSQFLKLGLKREAAQAEQQARRGIDKLREGVEKAAESVLGGEALALERARAEVVDLAKAIAAELAQSDPRFAEEQQLAEGQQRAAAPSQATPSKEGQPQKDSDDPNANDQKPEGSSLAKSDQQGQKPSDSKPGQKPGEGQSGKAGSKQPPSLTQSKDGKGSKPGQGSQPGSSTQGSGEGPAKKENPLSNLLTKGSRDGRGSSGPHLGPHGPLTSSEFVMWSDRMRDVEEMIDDRELSGEVARIRDKAREMRIEMKRHSKEPNWELVRTSVYGPMLELSDRLAEEIARLDPNREEIVPLDRDPVPERYEELVRRYYEKLGSGR